MRTIVMTVGLLILSNTFMTMAWYNHLKDRKSPLIIAILLSWAIALAEYTFQVPANRIGFSRFSLTQLKIMQECITLTVFTVYALIVFREPVRWNTALAMLLIVAAVFLTFMGGPAKQGG